MKSGSLGLILSLGLVLSGVAAQLQLPSWELGEREALEGTDWVAGADLLLIDEFHPPPMPPEETAVPLPTVADVLGGGEVEWIPDEFLDHYFGKKPEVFLLDPQGLLVSDSRQRRVEFLDYHAQDSKIDLFLYLFAAGQQIPGEVRVEEVAERLFGKGKPALVVFYFLGEPERAKIYLSPSLTDDISDAEQRRALKTSILAGMAKREPLDQLEAFCVQTSIRIYWMEKTAGLATEAADDLALVQAPAPAPLPSGLGEQGALLIWWWEKWGVVAVIGVATALCGLTLWVMAKSRAQYRFPEFEVAARLGGDHAAGIGAVIGFGSTTQSPSVQKNEIPGHLGGI